MPMFCEQIEQHEESRNLYHKKVKQLADWYSESVRRYSVMMKAELDLSKMVNELQETNVEKNILEDLTEDLSYSFQAKLAYFCVSDALVKLILSKYSAGPTEEFLQRHQLTFRPSRTPWLKCKADSVTMTEIVAKVLRDEETEFSIDFQALATDREVRSKLAHVSESSLCLSAMRSYHVICDMLTFLDPQYKDTLPRFSFDDMFSYDQFCATPCDFNFDDCTTVLIADSVHDVRADHRAAVANLRWDLVIDLDGYSDAGGLLSSVKDNCVLREVLYRAKANVVSQLPPNKTLWYRCGEYQSFSFEPSRDFAIAPYIHFHKDRAAKAPANLELILRQLLLSAQGQDRMINIVAVTDNAFLVKHLIHTLTSIQLDNYFLSWVGLTGDISRISDWYDDDLEQQEQHFRHHQCPICQFYQAFAEYGNWTPRISLSSSFTLPGIDGPVVLREIERSNLESCFEPLYDHCEQELPARAEEMRTSFYRGNSASWNAIAMGDVPRLRKSNDFERMKQTIRTNLGSVQAIPGKRLFFIQHTAGIGGSTLARQLVWDLHQDYAVLSVRSYHNSIKAQIEHLYDAVLDKAPIILLAEDTLPNFDRLCDDILHLERRCVLIAACRQSNTAVSKEIYPQAIFEPFLSIPNRSIELLQNRYHTMSTLPEAELARKDQDFSKDITGQMQTPFIIGLYYMEREFSIDSYVGKTLAECAERRYVDILACIAICDRYDRKNVPISFVNRALGFSQSCGFLRSVPAADSLIGTERHSSNIDCFHFKHTLLSSRFLELYCEKYYGSADNLQNALYENTLFLIDNMAAMRRNLQEMHLDILIFLLIKNKSSDPTNSYLSALMTDIAVPENQKFLMRRMADQFKPIADEILEEHDYDLTSIYDQKERQILRLVSHAYAHLGRMYSKMDGNYEKAFEEFDQAIYYKPDNDPNIYHMAGSALLDKLKNDWNNCPDGPLSPELASQMSTDVSRASEYFDYASDYGSAEYGYPSKLELLFRYLKFLFQTLDIRSAEDIPAQDSNLQQLQTEFRNTLEAAKAYSDFDDTARDLIADYESRFHSQIMFGNFSRAIEYYQNQVDRLKGTGDIGGLNNALRGLVFARIHAARTEYPDAPFYSKIKDPAKLIEDIEILLNQPARSERYADYSTRTQLFNYWMQLAKVQGRPIETGLAMARRWLELEDRNKQNKNPEPYYYMKILLYISAFDGSTRAMEELHKMDNEISRLDAGGAFDTRRGSLFKYRDIFIDGKEMGQLFNVRHCRTEEDILLSLAETGKKPVPLFGNFVQTQYNYALLQIFDPLCWNGETVWMDIGKNAKSAFTERQMGHKLSFVLGFSVQRPVALSRYAADQFTGETLDIDGYLRKAKQGKNKPTPAAQFTKGKQRITADENLSDKARRKTDIVPKQQEPKRREDKEEVNWPAIPASEPIETVLDAVNKNSARAHFDYAGMRCEVLIELKNAHVQKIAKQALKDQKPVLVRIKGAQKNGTYPGKLQS